MAFVMNSQKVLIKKIYPKKETVIMLTDPTKEDSILGEIVACDKHCGFEPGNRIIFKSGFEQLFYEGEELFVGKADNIIAKIV